MRPLVTAALWMVIAAGLVLWVMMPDSGVGQ
jgi:hypothetical protein